MRASLHRSGGFTIIEVAIVILLTSIMAAVAIPQFADYRKEAKDAKLQGFLGVLRTGVNNQYSQQVLRCQGKVGDWPFADSIELNDITLGATPRCTPEQVPMPQERKFTADRDFPSNPWGSPPAKTVKQCTGAGCTRCNPTGCDTTNFSGGWCYDVATGALWADSASNGGVAGEQECDY